MSECLTPHLSLAPKKGRRHTLLGQEENAPALIYYYE